MSSLKTSIFRQSTGWLRQRLSKRNTQGLEASGNIDDELWILLEYQSEIEEVGVKFAIQNGVNKRNAKKVYKHFQAYIRQAKNYYFSAKQLHPRSAGLLYYYCFLNLAKASLVFKHPTIAGHKISHGISCLSKDFTKLKTRTVKVLSDGGVFPKLYEWYFGLPIKPQSLNIQKLLVYCTDISYQNLIAGYGECKLLQGYYVHLVNVNQGNRTGWPLIGIATFNKCASYAKTFRSLYANFEKVELPQFSGREYFDAENLQLSAFTFFQSKQTFNWISDNIPPSLKSRDLVLKTFGQLLQPNYYKTNFDYYISLPYLPTNQIPMDETVAIYLIMFYLSNLVRYNPRYLEELLSKREAWIIDSFIRTCPLAYLRSMVSKIIGTDFIISGR